MSNLPVISCRIYVLFCFFLECASVHWHVKSEPPSGLTILDFYDNPSGWLESDRICILLRAFCGYFKTCRKIHFSTEYIMHIYPGILRYVCKNCTHLKQENTDEISLSTSMLCLYVSRYDNESKFESVNNSSRIKIRPNWTTNTGPWVI